LIESLIKTISKLSWKIDKETEWLQYYVTHHNYSLSSLHEKENIIQSWLQKLQPKTLWDLGANTGHFSVLAAPFCQQIIAFDSDVSCIERCYLSVKNKVDNILPLVLDLNNPTPALGWGHQERFSLQQRSPAQVILALGLVHHIAIVNHTPFTKIAEFFATLCHTLIIEFIPKEDSQVKKLLSNREDIFSAYDSQHFERAFCQNFILVDKQPIVGSNRVLYLFSRE
jgi:ribosomal protein L11 methylase PrmA